ncbi:23S rRNA (uracil(1939)-C(5))-methyltransferase RlmD [Ketobacter sp. MCCC 1A13808]|uniref:23S rRNA (uracil(1939)-C(5))-methyltransferase RlmD n=1 Tax=Ketobacter sp. MCCC 1A13808 TaxID=2602738 RepID=UPI000F1FA061|nr:23S rRNA (uracil(1939)-C(5))-methyltransferase RlmD [Ketobacter sp. MCCC 1A13808]MVF14678.1 23S rRNA (uracil(1939)-C(5))-methyltransferase RlmD [Ketobacter sp. MCCC 1A13808]RLP53954.1 MAG: 23S rRNA (uracil(1939)-C(5))-methyltransferase RlmD [Ketobacter sp.]
MARRRRKQKLPTEPVLIDITALSHDGRGIGRIDGKATFVDGALPGEQVMFEYTQKRSSFDEGRVVELLTAAANRVQPRCAQATICGGCSLQHLDPQAQIESKQSVLLEQLEHFGALQPQALLAPMTGPHYGYRRKARLGVKYVLKKESVLVGFREKRNSFLAEIEKCHVLAPEIGLIFPEIKALVMRLQARMAIPQIEVAKGDDATAIVVRHLEPLCEEDQAEWVKFCQDHQLHLYLQPAGQDSIHKVWPDDGNVRLSYQLPDFNLTMRFHPSDFTQVNQEINQQMIRDALQLMDVQPGERILDLFCGLGNFTLPLATKAATVVGVEGDEAMVQRGRENAQSNNIDNVEFYAADLTKPFDGQPWGQAGFDKILIDPPRSGALEIVAKMTVFRPKRIVYVSCNPATLARDAGELKKQGYSLIQAGVMDMFPHTTHVESIAVFEPE